MGASEKMSLFLLITLVNANVCSYDVSIYEQTFVTITKGAVDMRDVPKEKWLYHDRCMAKWMGFFMSDHTEYMGRKASEKPAVEKRKMSEEECDSVFRDAGCLAESWPSRWIRRSTTSTRLTLRGWCLV